MRSLATLTLAAALATLASPTPSAADSTSPGKESAFESTDLAPIPVSDSSVLLTATLAKGKKKRVLAIHATLATNIGTVGALHLLPSVNGVAVEGPIVNEPCDGGVLHCTASGTWWLDLDAAEAANPDVFVGEPLEVELVGGLLAGSDPDSSGTVTMSVQMLKK
jgi:hypothetical protein